MKKKQRGYKVVALLTNHDDDVYCFRKELLETLYHKGYKMIVSCPYGEKLSLLNSFPFKLDNVKIDRRGTNIWADFKLLIHYLKMLVQYRPDIVLTYTSKPNVYGSMAAALLKMPYINNITGLGSVLNKGKCMQKFILVLFKISFKRSSCIFFQNSSNMQLAKRKGLISGAYELIPGSGVNTERFPLQPYPDGGNGKEGLPVIFNYIGRVLYDKGIDDYIEVAKRIKKKYPNTEFNIIGFIEPTEEHYKEELGKLRKKDIVKYRGSQKDIKPWIERAHAIIHPSVYGEGMSNVLLENASSGRPIITTDNPGCRETVDDGKSGYIYLGRNRDELFKKIELFLQLKNVERQNMGVKGRQWVEQRFDRKLVIKAYCNKISEVIDDN